jgi:hypothetical protein
LVNAEMILPNELLRKAAVAEKEALVATSKLIFKQPARWEEVAK